MSTRLKLTIVVLLAVLLGSSAWFVVSAGSKSLQLLGSYRTVVSGVVVDAGGLPCNTHVNALEHLSLDGLRVTGLATLTFELSEMLEFRDIELRYTVGMGGDWGAEGGRLSVRPDTATFHALYDGSNAQTPVEEAMARQLRNNLAEHLHQQLRQRLLIDCQKQLDIMSVCQGGLVGRSDTTLVVLLRE